MKKIYLIIFVFCSVVELSAQNEPPVYERVWATYFGGQNTYINDSALDKSGNIYLAGRVYGEAVYINGFTTEGAYQPQYGGGFSDGIIAKFTPSGLLVWATFFGGSERDDIFALSVTEDNHLIVGGVIDSDDLTTGGDTDVFIAKFDLNGQFVWCTYYGGNDLEILTGLDTDRNNNIYIGGITRSSSGIATPGTFHPVHDFSLQYDAHLFMGFIAKFNGNGQLQWGTYYGNNSFQEGGEAATSKLSAIAVNDSGVFVSGQVNNSSIGLDTNYYFATEDAHQPTNSNAVSVGNDAYLSKFSLADGQRIWSTYYGGGGSEANLIISNPNASQDITTNRFNLAVSENYVYLAGGTASNSNITTPGSFKPTKTHPEEWMSHFLVKFDTSGNRIWGTYLGSIPFSYMGYDVNYVHTYTPGEGDGILSWYNSRFNFYPMRIAVSLDKNENVVVSGSTLLNNLASEGSYQEQKNNEYSCTDAYTTKISSDGTSLIYGTYYGGEYNETATKTLIKDHIFYIVGTTQSQTGISTSDGFQDELDYITIPDVKPYNGYIVKFATEEEELSTVTTDMTKAVIYPNPNNGTFYTELNENYTDSELYLFDTNGRVVHQQKIDAISTEIKTRNLQKGIYLLKVISNKIAVSYHSKIVIE